MSSSSSSFGLKKTITTTTGGVKGSSESAANSQKSIIEIYTDWANHYLDKIHGGRKKVKDLQTELQDGLILAEVIEAVMGAKVPEIHKKPKTGGQMEQNIQACLNFLAKRGVSVHDIHASDIKEGHLKAILGLFFQLSRYKQQQKMLAQERTQGTSTPKIPSVPPSPARGASGVSSGIPSPARSSGLQPPKAGTKSFLPGPQQRSMLDKLKGSRGTHAPPPPPLREIKRGLGKRTSSSSGFSSARSVGSESSVSLSSDTNFPSPSALRRINELEAPQQRPQSPKQQIKTTRVQTTKANSPRRSPKLQRSGTEIKDYGPIDNQHNYPPHHFSNLPKPAAASKIPNTPTQKSGIKPPSKIPGSPAKIPGTTQINSAKSKNNNNSKNDEALGCSVRPLQNEVSSAEVVVTSENDESTAQMTASFHSRTKSLPRTKRREDGSPGPSNVAVVSPMPTTPAKTASEVVVEAKSHKKEDSMVSGNSSEDPLKGLVPLGPLGLFSSTRHAATNGLKPTHQLPFSGRMEQLCSGTTLANHSVLTQGMENRHV